MVSKLENIEPQLEIVEHDNWVAVALSNKEKLSLYNKSQKSGISTDILEEVYHRGYHAYFAELAIDSELLTRSPEQYAFERVNSFISGGMASKIDEDLMEKVKEPTGALKSACWKGYTAVGMKMKNGRKVPNCVPKEEYTGTEKVSKSSDEPSSRFVGTTSLTNVYKKMTPGYETIKKTVREKLEEGKRK